MQTYKLSTTIRDSAGEVLEGAMVRAELNKADFSEDGTIFPVSQTAFTDSEGYVEFDLVSNLEGTRDSRYRIVAFKDELGRKPLFIVQVQMPMENVNLEWLVDKSPITPEYSTASALSAGVASSAAHSAMEAEANALLSEQSASASEQNASDSAGAALQSEQNAYQSEQNAFQSEQNAGISEQNASDSAGAALQSEQNAFQSEQNASGSAGAALQSEQNAFQSEQNAAGSAGAALESEQNAAASELKAEQEADRAEAASTDATNLVESGALWVPEFLFHNGEQGFIGTASRVGINGGTQPGQEPTIEGLSNQGVTYETDVISHWFEFASNDYLETDIDFDLFASPFAFYASYKGLGDLFSHPDLVLNSQGPTITARGTTTDTELGLDDNRVSIIGLEYDGSQLHIYRQYHVPDVSVTIGSASTSSAPIRIGDQFEGKLYASFFIDRSLTYAERAYARMYLVMRSVLR